MLLILTLPYHRHVDVHVLRRSPHFTIVCYSCVQLSHPSCLCYMSHMNLRRSINIFWNLNFKLQVYTVRKLCWLGMHVGRLNSLLFRAANSVSRLTWVWTNEHLPDIHLSQECKGRVRTFLVWLKHTNIFQLWNNLP